MFMRRLMVGLLLSLFGSAIFTFWLSTKLKSKPEAKLHYLAPVSNLDAGMPIAKEQLKTVDWPAGTPLIGAFTKPEDLVGRTVLYPIAAGEPILDRTLAASGSGAGLVTHIPDGMRAISLRSDAINGVAGFLLPGTHVDVLVSYHATDLDSGASGMITSTVLQDVPILTAGQQMQPDPTGKPALVDVVTMLVDPIDAQKATLAAAQGTVHFVLRNGTDHERMEQPPLQVVSLNGHSQPFTSGGASASAAALGAGAPRRSSVILGPTQGSLTATAPLPQRPVRPEPEIKAGPKPYQVTVITGTKQSTESFQ